MATHAHTTPTPTTGRRRLAGGLMALAAAASAVGITAGAAASSSALALDAALLSLRADLAAAVAEIGRTDTAADPTDEEVDAAGTQLSDICQKIVGAPPAQTALGRALKCAAAMQQLRFSFSFGNWPGEGEAMAWAVLSELAGDAYVPTDMPAHLRATEEPGRA